MQGVFIDYFVVYKINMTVKIITAPIFEKKNEHWEGR